MPNEKEQAGEAKTWGNHYGPLGIQTRSDVPQLQGRPAFAENVPNAIRTANGELGLNAAEVLPVMTLSRLSFTGEHREKLVRVSFPIGKTGRFSNTYAKNCPKSEQMSQRQTAWLAQQRDDGSWPRLRGYTGDGWDTAWCGLALMSAGDKKYDTQIRKAAYRIAYENAPSE